MHHCTMIVFVIELKAQTITNVRFAISNYVVYIEFLLRNVVQQVLGESLHNLRFRQMCAFLPALAAICTNCRLQLHVHAHYIHMYAWM